MDAIAIYQAEGQTCIQVFFFRSGANYGNRAYYPSHAHEDGIEVVLEAFLGQFYAKAQKPKTVLLSHNISNHSLLSEALSVSAGRKVQLFQPKKGY